MRFIILLLMLTPISLLNAQPVISKQQMYEDVVFLQKTIKDVCPHLQIRKHVTGIDLVNEIDSLTLAVDNCKNFEDFYYLVQRMLLLTQDQHNCLSGFYYAEQEEENPTITEQSIELTALCEMEYMCYHPAGSLLVAYSNGKYYVENNQYFLEGNLAIPNGVEIIAINDISIKKYVTKYNRQIDNSVRWDFELNNFYTRRLFLPTENREIISFKDENNDTLHIQAQPFSMKSNLVSDAFDLSVFYETTDKLLYIRIPSMDEDNLPFLTSEILQYKDKPIAKVVIDIRENRGGSDKVWIEVLGIISSDPISVKEKCYIRNTETALNYAITYRNMKVDNNYAIYCEQEFVSISDDSTTTYQPSDRNLGYRGNIYVLVNDGCFSSALAFSAFCNRNERFVTVGKPSGYIGGRGVTPFFFELPNSHLVFTISPVLDASFVEKPVDFYDHRVDVSVKQPLDEVIVERNLNSSTKRYSKSYLYKNDSVFKAVLLL